MKWNYWKDREYYRQELKDRALGNLPEMEAARYIAELVSKEQVAGDEILDVGCGPGHFVLSLQRSLPNLSYTGVDITSEYVRDAQEIFSSEGHKFLEADARALPFSENQFDISICSNTIPHIPNASQALRELIRVTRRVVFVRMLIGNETLITKKALSDQMDQNGEPTNFMYVNIFSEQ